MDGLQSEARQLLPLLQLGCSDEELFVLLDRIRRMAVDAIIEHPPRMPGGQRVYAFVHSISDHVYGIVAHPNYRPPKGWPPK
jgi:hypothetical protein